MGGISFGPQQLADRLSDAAGYKAGLALSLAELCDHLSGTEYPDVILASEESVVRLRSEEYDALYFKLLHRIGYTAEEYDGDYSGVKLFHKYQRRGLRAEYEGMLRILNDVCDRAFQERAALGPIDLTPVLVESHKKYGKVGLEMALEKVEALERGIKLNPYSAIRSVEWKHPLHLAKLFTGTAEQPELGRYIDQRFVNYLSRNPQRLIDMHWRKFEELTAEYFDREGYQVKLGPGSNDDGVDIRIWAGDAATAEKPLCLVQCKRQKSKVDRVVVKGLYSDVQFEGAEYGVVANTSELSRAARTTIAARGYPIREIHRDAVIRWLERLRTPGTGIIRV